MLRPFRSRQQKKEVDIKIAMKLEVTCRQFCGLVCARHHSFELEFWLAMDQSCFREKQGQQRDSKLLNVELSDESDDSRTSC